MMIKQEQYDMAVECAKSLDLQARELAGDVQSNADATIAAYWVIVPEDRAAWVDYGIKCSSETKMAWNSISTIASYLLRQDLDLPPNLALWVADVLDGKRRTRPKVAARETNPAGEAIDGALPPMPKVKAHLRALPYQDIGSALETVEGSQASIPARLCFRFLVLTAARSGEARGARWDEIDLQSHVWRIPSERMKAGKEHRAPLSVQALELLGEASALRDESGLVFPSPLKPGAPMSDMTLTKLLRSTGLSERATVHGFRSSFKNWTLEQTDAPWAVSEAALAHILGNSTEQAYARSDLFERRRALMQQWAEYLTG